MGVVVAVMEMQLVLDLMAVIMMDRIAWATNAASINRSNFRKLLINTLQNVTLCVAIQYSHDSVGYFAKHTISNMPSN